MFLGWKIQYCKDVSSPQTGHHIQAIPDEFYLCFFMELYKQTQNNAEINVKGRDRLHDTMIGLIPLDIKNYCKVVIIQSVWCWHKDRQRWKQLRTLHKMTNPYTCGCIRHLSCLKPTQPTPYLQYHPSANQLPLDTAWGYIALFFLAQTPQPWVPMRSHLAEGSTSN